MPALVGNDLYPLAASELASRRIDHDTRWDYYEGKQKVFLKIREGEPDYNVIVNLAARVVEQSVNFLIGKMPQFDLPGDDEKTASMEKMIVAWLERYDGEELLNDLFTTGAVCGHVFVKLVMDGQDVRPTYLDPSLVTVFWDPTDKSRPVGYMITWDEQRGNEVVIHREDHMRSENGTNWVIRSYTGNGATWTIAGEDMIWPYPFSQIVDWKNLPNPRGYYGKSDLEKGILRLNDIYNFRQSNTNKILYIHAHPRTVAFGVDRTKIQNTTIDGLWTIPETNADVKNLEMQSDLESSRQHALDMKADFFGDAQMVDLSALKDKIGQITNFGLRLMFAEALAKNRKKRLLAGRGLAEMIRRAGEIMRLDWSGISVTWDDPLPENENEQVTNAKEKIAMKVASRQTEAERMGYDWERERKRMDEERAQTGYNLEQALLNAMRDPNTPASQDTE